MYSRMKRKQPNHDYKNLLVHVFERFVCINIIANDDDDE